MLFSELLPFRKVPPLRFFFILADPTVGLVTHNDFFETLTAHQPMSSPSSPPLRGREGGGRRSGGGKKGGRRGPAKRVTAPAGPEPHDQNPRYEKCNKNKKSSDGGRRGLLMPAFRARWPPEVRGADQSETLGSTERAGCVVCVCGRANSRWTCRRRP